MGRVDVTIPEFLKAVVHSSIKSEYAGMVFVLARTADGDKLQNELYEDWPSLNDLTYDQILLIVAGKETEITYGVAEFEEPVEYKAEGLSIESGFGSKWRWEFLSKMLGKKYWKYWGAFPQPPETKKSFKAAITSATSDAAHYFGIPERYLPCIVIIPTNGNIGIIVSVVGSGPNFKIYSYLQTLLIDFEPFVTKIRAQQKVIFTLNKEILELEQNLRREQKTIRKYRNWEEQWKLKQKIVMRWLDNVKNVECYQGHIKAI